MACRTFRGLQTSALAISLLFGVATVGQATPITVTNFSFESPDLLNDGDLNFGVITGWVATPIHTGVWDPLAGQFSPVSTHGVQIAYSNADDSIGSAITQGLAATLAADTQYTLLVDVGNRFDPGGTPLFAFNYSVALWAGGTPLGSANPPIADGVWGTATVSFFAAPGNPLLGLPLEIRLSNPADPSYVGGAQVSFDNVRLDATAVPEPATLLLFGTGLAAAGVRRYRQRKQSVEKHG